MADPSSKNILKSKTFWTNLLLGAAQVGGVLPSKYGVPIQTIVNLVLRVVTDMPVTDRKSTRLNSSHSQQSRMPSSA